MPVNLVKGMQWPRTYLHQKVPVLQKQWPHSRPQGCCDCAAGIQPQHIFEGVHSLKDGKWLPATSTDTSWCWHPHRHLPVHHSTYSYSLLLLQQLPACVVNVSVVQIYLEHRQAPFSAHDGMVSRGVHSRKSGNTSSYVLVFCWGIVVGYAVVLSRLSGNTFATVRMRTQLPVRC